ncbi:MAG TPA: site-specific integrase [Mycobacteriales bacterium]|nr:site-specific integrase [Mycobacteriales bacterium]
MGSLRIGEALALRWSDLDLDAGTLRVSGTLYRVGGALTRTEPKSARSRRTLPLLPEVVETLKARRQAQRADRLAAGPAWQETDLVFTTEIGTPLDHRNVLRWYRKVTDEAGVHGSPHTLRHTTAAALIAAGVPVRVIAGSGVLVTTQQISLAVGVATLGTLFVTRAPVARLGALHAAMFVLAVQATIAVGIAVGSRGLPQGVPQHGLPRQDSNL